MHIAYYSNRYVGLAGEVRMVDCGQDLLKEAAKFGITQADILRSNSPRQKNAGMEIIAVGRVDKAVEKMRQAFSENVFQHH